MKCKVLLTFRANFKKFCVHVDCIIFEDVYGSVRSSRKGDYLTSINAGDDDDEGEDELVGPMTTAKANYSAPKRFVEEAAKHAQVGLLFFHILLSSNCGWNRS